MEETKLINLNLKREYGLAPDGRPKFRLIWSESADGLEKRKGAVDVFYGPIFVRTEVGVHEWKKMNYVDSRWVIERLAFNPTGEIASDTKETYEPIWVFQDKKGNYLRPLWVPTRMIVDQWLIMAEGKAPKRTLKQDKAADEEAFAQEVDRFKDYLDQEFPYTASMLANREAIVVPEMPKKDNFDFVHPQA